MLVDEDRLRRLERTLLTQYGALMTLREYAEMTGRNVKCVYNERAAGTFAIPSFRQGKKECLLISDVAYALLEAVQRQEERNSRRDGAR